MRRRAKCVRGRSSTIQLIAQRTARGRLHDGWRRAGFAAGHIHRERAERSRCSPGRSRITRKTGDDSRQQRRGGVSITDEHGQPLASYELEPLLITGLSEDANRTKRRLMTYDEIPPNLVQAVVAIEDRRFFEHGGVDYIRMLGAIAQRSDAGAPLDGRRLDADDAAGARILSDAGAAHQAQAHRDRDHLPARAPLYQEADLRRCMPTRSTWGSAAVFPSTDSAKRRRRTSAKMCGSSTWRSARCWRALSRARTG